MSQSDEDQLRHLLTSARPPTLPGPELADVVVRAGRRRRAVRRVASGVGTAVVVGGATLLVVPALDSEPVRPADGGRITPAPLPSPTGTGSAPETGQPTPQPTSAPVDGISMAVTYGTSVAIYSVDNAGTAVRRGRQLAPPTPGASVLDVSVASGSDPVACVVWQLSGGDREDGSERALACYTAGSGDAVVADEAGTDPNTVAVSPDGSHVAWSQDRPGHNGAVAAATLDGAEVGQPRRWLADPARPTSGEQAFTGSTVDDLAWAGNTSRLVLSVAVQSDDDPGLAVLDTSEQGQGWLPRPLLAVPSPQAPGELDRYRSVSSASETTALALLSSYENDGEAPGQRAVEVDLSSGEVRATLSVPAEGRDVVAVSGSSRAAVYSTAPRSGGEETHYVRWPGDAKGSPLEGLPPGARVVAGP